MRCNTPPSQADIDREANEIEAFLVKELENARNEPGARLADDMVRAVDIGETVTSPQGQVDLFKAIRASATPKVMLEISKAIFAAPVTRVVLTTPTAAGGNSAVLAALKAPVTARDDPAGDRESRFRGSSLPSASRARSPRRTAFSASAPNGSNSPMA